METNKDLRNGCSDGDPKLDIVKLEEGSNVYLSLVEKYKHTVITELLGNLYMINSVALKEENSVEKGIYLKTSYVLVGEKSMVEVQLPYGPLTNFNFNKDEQNPDIPCIDLPIKKSVYDRGWSQVGFDNFIRPHLEKIDYQKLKISMAEFL